MRTNIYTFKHIYKHRHDNKQAHDGIHARMHVQTSAHLVCKRVVGGVIGQVLLEGVGGEALSPSSGLCVGEEAAFMHA